MVFFKVFVHSVSVSELMVRADDQDQLLPLEPLLKTVHVELVQITHLAYHKYSQIELRSLLKTDVHVQSDVPHIRFHDTDYIYLLR